MRRTLALIAAAFLVALCGFEPDCSATPSISLQPTYNKSLGAILWEVKVTQDTDESLAVELPFALHSVAPAFASFLNDGGDATNGTAGGTWYYNETAAGSGTLIWNTQGDAANETQNTGNNPFTGTITRGLQLDAANKRLFASLGSAINLPDADPVTPGKQVATLHIVTSDGVMSWSNAIVAELGVHTILSGSKGSVMRGDINGDGKRNFLDVVPFGQRIGNPILYALSFPGLDGLARSDMNANGTLNFLDVVPFGNCLSNPAVCPADPSGSGAGSNSVAVAIAGVPEPSTICLLGVALAGFAVLRFNRSR